MNDYVFASHHPTNGAAVAVRKVETGFQILLQRPSKDRGKGVPVVYDPEKGMTKFFLSDWAAEALTRIIKEIP